MVDIASACRDAFDSSGLSTELQISCEVANMLMPEEMRRKQAPPPAGVARCVVTGQPAKYKDPLTGLPFSDASAFGFLRQNYQPQIVHRQPQAARPSASRKREGDVLASKIHWDNFCCQQVLHVCMEGKHR